MTFSIIRPIRQIDKLEDGLKYRKSVRLVIEKAKVPWVIKISLQTGVCKDIKWKKYKKCYFVA
ncbi:MAG: hypothetical protein HYW90_00100 [Candidatus Sungbacteria bacterium]|nr:hypothetical protein [Candidatus Sungbacteria bacterium]